MYWLFSTYFKTCIEPKRTKQSVPVGQYINKLNPKIKIFTNLNFIIFYMKITFNRNTDSGKYTILIKLNHYGKQQSYIFSNDSVSHYFLNLFIHQFEAFQILNC